MRIYINNDGKPLNIILPSGLIFNNLVANICKIKIKDEYSITSEQLRNIFKIIKKTKKHYKGWVFLEIIDEGETVIRIIP